ncbi:hypothetical protein [Azospirillum sp.]|uniref:hypothetical protein n=1 Tax=Azospirillum sp. TaxID=34012 RepID=UPI002D62A499|nr:hypothetical protein [Azospirillum sp.]HYD67597.1 hypothetical protein [Azospirillum sp.]
MAFAPKDLSVLAYANGFTLWHYTTADAHGDVDTTGYFNGAADLLRTGDMILANTGASGTAVGGIFLVAGNASGTVDVANLTQVGATDSD